MRSEQLCRVAINLVVRVCNTKLLKLEKGRLNNFSELFIILKVVISHHKVKTLKMVEKEKEISDT